MIAAVEQGWAQLSPRERVLVGVAGVLALLVLVWLAAQMMLAALDGQAKAQNDVFARAARIEAKAQLLARPAEPAAAAMPAGNLDQILSQLAADTGLTLDRNDARGESGAVIAIASARAPALVGWLSGLEEGGIVIDRLAITPGTDGSVALTAELRRP